MANDGSKIIYHGFLSEDIWRNLEEIEVLLKRLPGDVNKIKREVLDRIESISDKLDALIRQGREENLSRATIARRQLMRNKLNPFKDLAQNYPSNPATERKAELLKLQLLGRLRNFSGDLEKVLNE